MQTPYQAIQTYNYSSDIINDHTQTSLDTNLIILWCSLNSQTMACNVQSKHPPSLSALLTNEAVYNGSNLLPGWAWSISSGLLACFPRLLVKLVSRSVNLQLERLIGRKRNKHWFIQYVVLRDQIKICFEFSLVKHVEVTLIDLRVAFNHIHIHFSWL